jgi:hypothetical protein
MGIIHISHYREAGTNPLGNGPGSQGGHVSMLSHKLHDFREKYLLKINCVFWLSAFVGKVFNSFHVKCLSFFSDFNQTWIIYTNSRKIKKLIIQ